MKSSDFIFFIKKRVFNNRNRRHLDTKSLILTNILFLIVSTSKQLEKIRFVATTHHGLEEVLADELKALGATNIRLEKRAVTFEGDQKLMYKANLCVRTALRILKPLTSFRARHESAFYNKIKKIDWSQYFTLDQTFAIHSVASSDYFTHTKYISQKAKDAIVDQFREKTRKRPSVQIMEPDFRLYIHIINDECNLYWDSSGESLHKRGYRVEHYKAPINEVLAAGMIKLSGWEADSIFIDPMCGSGTILAEAAMIAYNIAPQLHRKYFSFKNWKDFNAELWEEVRQEAIAAERPFKYEILGFDVAFQAVRVAERNLERGNLADKIQLNRKDFERHTPPEIAKGIVIMNPPYGERIETVDYEINGFYAMMGDHMKEAYTNYKVWMISSNKEALKCIGLKPKKKHTLYNGALECKFQCYTMYRGSMKKKATVES